MANETSELIDRANTSINEFLSLDATSVDPKIFGRIYQQANVGLKIRHDALVNDRMENEQRLRAISMAFSDSKTREEYIRRTAPKMLPPK